MSSSDNEKKKTSAGKVHASAAWEWFKEAAWLQVLLIVGVVVALVISIPYIVSAITNAVDDTSSDFFNSHRIKYDEYTDMVIENTSASDAKTDGAVGEGKTTWTEPANTTKEGFVVLFYKSNCDNCNTMQSHVEDWYDNFNSKYANNNIKFYTIDVSWDDDNDDDAKNNEGTPSLYDNQYITLDQQQDVVNNIRDVYLAQDNAHQNSAVTETTLNTALNTNTGASTLPTPCFLTFTRDKDSTDPYTYDNLTQVTFGAIGSLSLSSDTDISTEMFDIYQFQRYSNL